MKDNKPYLYIGHYQTLATVATSLKIDIRNLASKKETRGNAEDFQRNYFEKQVNYLAKYGQWDGFMDVLALIIYGVLLFPNIKDFIDFAVIDVLLAYKHNGRNPILAIVADTMKKVTESSCVAYPHCIYSLQLICSKVKVRWKQKLIVTGPKV